MNISSIWPFFRIDSWGPWGSSWLLLAPSGSSWLLWRSQEEPRGARRGQEGPGGARKSQEAPRGGRRSQEEQGGVRRSQEQPGGPLLLSAPGSSSLFPGSGLAWFVLAPPGLGPSWSLLTLSGSSSPWHLGCFLLDPPGSSWLRPSPQMRVSFLFGSEEESGSQQDPGGARNPIFPLCCLCPLGFRWSDSV